MFNANGLQSQNYVIILTRAANSITYFDLNKLNLAANILKVFKSWPQW